MHTFPAAGCTTDVFGSPATDTGTVSNITTEWATKVTGDPCGVLQVQNIAVGAAFVGAVAAAFAIAEILRVLAGGPATAVMSCTLSAVEHIDVVLAETALPRNPGYQRAA